MDLKRLEELNLHEELDFQDKLKDDKKLKKTMLDQLVVRHRAIDVLPSIGIIPHNMFFMVAKENNVRASTWWYRYIKEKGGICDADSIIEFDGHRSSLSMFSINYEYFRTVSDSERKRELAYISFRYHNNENSDSGSVFLRALAKQVTWEEVMERAEKRIEEEKITGKRSLLRLDLETKCDYAIQNIFAVNHQKGVNPLNKGDIFHIYLDLGEGEKIDIHSDKNWKFLFDFLKSWGNNGIPLYTLCSVFAREIEFRQNDKHTKRVQAHNEAIEAERRLYEQQAQERERLLKMQIDAQQSQIDQLIQALKGGK